MTIDSSWWVDFGPNGGFLGAVLTRTVELEASRLGISHRPASASIHYLRPPHVGPAIVSARLIRSGRTTTVLYLDFQQENVGSLVTALFTLVEPTADGSAAHASPTETMAPPPAPDGGRPLFDGASPAYLDHWEFQPVRGLLPFSSPMSTPAGPLDCAGWLRLREDHPVDAPLLAAMADAWAPVIFGVLDGPTLVPTLSLSLLWRVQLSETPWCFMTLRTEALSGGLVDETVEIRAEDGTLLLQGRQLAQFNATAHGSVRWNGTSGPQLIKEEVAPCA